MRNNLKIYMLAFVSFMVSTSEFIIAGILDKVAASAHISISAAGQLITAFSLANAIGAPIVIIATAKLARRKILIVSLALFVLGCALTLIPSGFWFLIVSRIILAVGSGVFVITAKTIAARLASPGHRAGAIAIVITGFSAALIIGVPIGRVVASVYNWKIIFLGIGILSFISIFALARTMPNVDSEATTVPLNNQIALFKDVKILIAIAVTFFWQFGYSLLFAYISPFLLAITSMSDGWISTSLFAFGIAGLIGSRFGGFMSDRFGVHWSLSFSLIANVLAMVLLAAFARSTPAAISLLMIWALAAWSTGPILQYKLILLAPESSGIMLSLYGSVLQLSVAAAAGIGGITVGSFSVLTLSWIGAVAVAIAVLLEVVSLKFTPPTPAVDCPCGRPH